MIIRVEGKLTQEITDATLRDEIAWGYDPSSNIYTGEYKEYRLSFNRLYEPDADIDAINLMVFDNNKSCGIVKNSEGQKDWNNLLSMYNFLEDQQREQFST